MKRIKKKFLSIGGFTLVELLAVLIIVGILAAVSAPIYVQYVKSARAADPQTAMGAIVTANKVYYQKFGRYTSTLEDLDIKVDEATRAKWGFELDANDQSFATVTATSTEAMEGGSGEIITYHVQTGKFEGYGQDK